MPPLLQPVTYLSPPKGPALVLTDNETWLGRGSFELSEKAYRLCSRKQACLKIANSGVTLECHGLNSIYFVVCHAANFQASEDALPSRLHQLKKGEAVELVDGDKFYLAPNECLLTVAIKAVKSEDDEASEQLAPDGSLAVHVCSPKATQLGQALTNSVVEERTLLQTVVPFSAEVCVNVAERPITEDGCIRCPTEHKRCLCPSDEICQCSVVENAPFGLQVPVIEDSSVHQVDLSKSARIGDSGRGEVAIDIRKGEGDPSEISSTASRHFPEQFRLHSSRAEGLLDPTQGVTQAADSFVHGKRCGPSINASEEILIRNFQPDPVCDIDSQSPLKLGGHNHRVARDGSKQATPRNVSNCTSYPTLTGCEDPAPVEVVIDSRRSINVDPIAIVSDGEHIPEFRSDSSAAGGASLNSSDRCTLAGCSVDGRACGTSDDITGEVFVQNFQSDTIDSGLVSRGPTEVILKRFPDALEAGKQLITRNVSGCTSSPLCSSPNQVQDDRCATDRQQNSLPLEQICNAAGIPVDTRFPESVGASTSVAILGRNGAAEMLDMLMKQGNAEPNPPPKSVRRSPIPPRGDVFSVAPTICEDHHARESLSTMPEFVDLTLSQNDEKSQAQIQSETAQAGHSTSNMDRTSPVDDMTKVVVTVSGYEDLLRARLINLISAVGAAYTGSLTKLNTHVVCWKFGGAKYEMAKKLGKKIVNHSWLEDCQRAGRRLPEEPYYASGEMSEPLRWDQSIVQCPPKAESDHDQECIFLSSSGRSLGQSRSVLVIGESSRSAKTGQSGPSTFSPRSHAGTVDRGKRHLDVNRLANRNDDYLDDRQIRVFTRTGDSPAVNLSTCNRPREQESDDFWNAVISAYDDGNELVTEQSCQVLSEADYIAGLADNKKGRPRHPSQIPGSSLRGLDPYQNEIESGRRNAISNLAECSRNVEDQKLQGAAQPNSLLGEAAGNMHTEVDHRSSYPEVYHRKRKHALEIAKDGSCQSRRSVRKSEVSAVSGALPSQVENVAGTSVDIATESRPDLRSGCVQAEPSTVDTTDNLEQTSCVIIAESVGKTGEKRVESAPTTEILCVICHSDSQSTTEGVLSCGHQFCFPCIQRWADEAKSKSPTCPLCKVPFDFITFREMGHAGEDGSCAVLDERIVQIGQQIPQETRFISLPSLRTENLCVNCGSRDTPELLLVCYNCRERACHTFCLDPPRPPGSSWFCSRCSQIQSRMQTREAYGRLFHGSSPRSARQRQGTVDVEINVALQSRSISHDGAVVVGQSSGIPLEMNQAPQSGLTSRADGLNLRQSSGTPPRRGRQYSLHSFLVRLNDT